LKKASPDRRKLCKNVFYPTKYKLGGIRGITSSNIKKAPSVFSRRSLFDKTSLALLRLGQLLHGGIQEITVQKLGGFGCGVFAVVRIPEGIGALPQGTGALQRLTPFYEKIDLPTIFS
jgi:hypothetical protein